MTASPLGRQPRWTDDSTLDNVLHLMEQVAETILLKENVKLPFDRQEREELRAGYRDWLIEAAENTDLFLHYDRYMALRILVGVGEKAKDTAGVASSVRDTTERAVSTQ